MKPSPTLRVPRLVAKVGILRILAIRDYRLLWLSTISASFAMQMQVIARGWLIYDMTGSPLDLAWVTLSYMVPWVIFSMLGGVLADRFHQESRHNRLPGSEHHRGSGSGDLYVPSVPSRSGTSSTLESSTVR